MLCIHRPLALAMVGVVLLSALVSALFQRAMVRYERIVREQNAVITGDFNEGITGSLTVKLLGIAAKMDRSFFRDTEKMRRTSVGSARVGAFFTASVALMSQTALALVLWQGGILNREGVMMIGTLSVFLSYALGIMEPIRQLVRTFSRLTAISASIERFTDLMNTEPGIRDSEEVVERYGDSFNPKKENWEELYGDVEFEDVTFIYPDGEEKVLEHFSLKVKRGQNVAIVGETGAGKSTLVNLICRFYEPVEGRVLIDGRDVRERSLLWLHSHIGYVLQTPYLFSGSIRENLKYGRENATDEEIMQALAMVSADGIVKAMEQGLDSEVGEGGMSLSTGEKQLISFARALLSDPAILILDEATSSVDTVTEQKIQKAISVLTKDRTSFVIAHRLSTIVDSDLILAVSEGRIVEQGTHRELMQRKGYYYTLYTRQFEQLAVDSIDKNKNI